MTGRPPLPTGFRLRFDAAARTADNGRVLVSRDAGRVLRLTPRGAAIRVRLRHGDAVGDGVEGALARRVVDAGIADPVAPELVAAPSMSVVVPARDRPGHVEACLAALAGHGDVVVCDDGSHDHAALATVAAARGATVVRLRDNRGPAAARNSGAQACGGDVLAFVDSDACVSADALATLAAHFADPCVGAVAPRVIPDIPAGTALARFARVRSPLDMGARAADVGLGVVPYVPSAVLLVRRSAFAEVGGFDETLRYGEDVDLVWRLVARGWTVRYDPTVVATHREPDNWAPWLRRRFRYGTSAARLAARHPARMRGPALLGLAAPVRVLRAVPRLRDGRLPTRTVVGPAMTAPARTLTGILRWGVPLWWPVLAALAARRRSRPLAVAALATPAALEWRDRRPSLDPVRYALAALADDAAYGAGVWFGCLQTGTPTPLLPRWTPPPRRSTSA